MQELLPKPDRVPRLEALLMPKHEDADDEDLERLAEGLKVHGASCSCLGILNASGIVSAMSMLCMQQLACTVVLHPACCVAAPDKAASFVSC